MQRYIRHALNFCAAFALFAPGMAAAADKDVLVTNDATSPVPVIVTGETAGTITGDVSITNDENSPVPVTLTDASETEYVRIPFEVEIIFEGRGQLSTPYTVRKDKRLLMDSVSCKPVFASEMVSASLQSNTSDLFVPIIDRLPDPRFQAYQQISEFLEGNDDFYLLVLLENPNSQQSTTFSCQVSGRLVDL